MRYPADLFFLPSKQAGQEKRFSPVSLRGGSRQVTTATGEAIDHQTRTGAGTGVGRAAALALVKTRMWSHLRAARKDKLEDIAAEGAATRKACRRRSGRHQGAVRVWRTPCPARRALQQCPR